MPHFPVLGKFTEVCVQHLFCSRVCVYVSVSCIMQLGDCVCLCVCLFVCVSLCVLYCISTVCVWTLGERCVSHRWLSSKWPSVTPLTNLVTSFHCKKGHSDDHEEDSRTMKPRSRVSGLENMAESLLPCWKLRGWGHHLHTADNQGLAALSCVWGGY